MSIDANNEAGIIRMPAFSVAVHDRFSVAFCNPHRLFHIAYELLHLLYIAATMPLSFAEQLQTVADSRSPPIRGVYDSQTARKDIEG